MPRVITASLALSGLVAAGLIVSACSPAPAVPQPTPDSTLTATLVPAQGVLKLEESVGVPPAAGWKWAVSDFDIGADARTDGPHEHDFAWVFYAIKGSAEVTIADARKAISAGEGVPIPGGQQHSHRYLPQSKLIAFHLRPADQPAAALHRGGTVLLSEKALELRPGSAYKLQIREYTLPPGSRTSENLTSDPNFAYVADGVVSYRLGQTATTVEAGKSLVLPLNERYVISNEGTTPLRFVLVDVRP